MIDDTNRILTFGSTCSVLCDLVAKMDNEAAEILDIVSQQTALFCDDKHTHRVARCQRVMRRDVLHIGLHVAQGSNKSGRSLLYNLEVSSSSHCLVS